MPAQGLREGHRAETGAAFEEDLARQEEIFEERAAELLAEHPDRFIAVCAGEVFVGDSDAEAASRARAAHPGRPFFLRLHDPLFAPARDPDGAGRPGTAAGAPGIPPCPDPGEISTRSRLSSSSARRRAPRRAGLPP